MNIKCKICKCSFEWERNGRGGRQPTICLRSECRKIRDRLCYEKWKENHSYTRYEKRNEEKEKEPDTAYRATSQPEQHECRKCGKLSNNVFNCPACLSQLMEGCSDQYQECVYGGGTDISRDILGE